MDRCVGLNLGLVNPSLWLPLAELADRVGIESVWLPEHLVFPVEMAGSPHDGDSHPPIPSNTRFSRPAWRTGRISGWNSGAVSASPCGGYRPLPRNWTDLLIGTWPAFR